MIQRTLNSLRSMTNAISDRNIHYKDQDSKQTILNLTTKLDSDDEILDNNGLLEIENNSINQVNYSTINHQNVIIEKQGGLKNHRVFIYLLLWYLFSALTLFLNKYIVSNGKLDPMLLGLSQMAITSLCGFIQISLPNLKINVFLNIKNDRHRTSNNRLHYYFNFCKNMLIIGSLRLFSIILGLVALKQAAISFVETVKSSSPIFTVAISRLLIGEHIGFWTNMTLLPIMLGLTLCSSFEINFSLFGFLAAILTNLTEWYVNYFI